MKSLRWHFVKAVLPMAIALSLWSCQKPSRETKTVVFFENKKADWIQDHQSLPTSDSLFYLEDPAPLFRKTSF